MKYKITVVCENEEYEFDSDSKPLIHGTGGIMVIIELEGGEVYFPPNSFNHVISAPVKS